MLAEAGRTWRITCKTGEVNGVLAALRAGIGVAPFPASLVPADLQVLPPSEGLPELGGLDFTLVANPRSAAEPIDALVQAILRRQFKAVEVKAAEPTSDSPTS